MAAETMTTSPSLLLHAEKLMPQPARLMACCPTMDLLAIVSTEEQLNVYRFGGQRAFGLQRRSQASTVSSLQWKFNGQYLAVGWSDGIVEVVSAETGNVLQHFRQGGLAGKRKGTANAASISCMAWGLNFVDVNAVKGRISKEVVGRGAEEPIDTWNTTSTTTTPTLDDFLERVPDVNKVEIPLDLPDQLARIDVTASMPKLPPLALLPPAAYKNGDHSAAELFASQMALDAALQPSSSNDVHGLEAMLLTQDTGQIRVILYDALSIGNIDLPQLWKLKDTRFLKSTSHPFSDSYLFHMSYQTTPSKSFHALVPLPLRFLRDSGTHLHIVEQKTAQLELLVQYLSETLLALSHHWTHAMDLPSRFMANVNESLSEKNEPNLTQSLFHLAATGDCSSPTLKEWLVDILAERGHKRWDTSVTHGYTKVLELCGENLLPALERCAAILGQLRGLSLYNADSPVSSIPQSTFDAIFDIIRAMRLLAHHILLFGSEEMQQFGIFSKWLRHEIDSAATERVLSPEEEVEQDVNIDHELLFHYLRSTFEKSRLDACLHFVDGDLDTSVDTLGGPKADVYTILKEALTAFKIGDGECDVDLLSLSTYFSAWKVHNQTLVEAITAQQRASSVIEDGLVIADGEIEVSDVRMVWDQTLSEVNSATEGDDINMSTFFASVAKDTPNRVSIKRILHAADFESVRAIDSISEVVLQLPSSAIIVDMHFSDDTALLLLIKNQETEELPFHVLLSIPYRPPFSAAASSTITPKCLLPNGAPPSLSPKVLNMMFDDLTKGNFVKHIFPADDSSGFFPARFQVNGRRDRRYVAVLGTDERRVRIYDLDFGGEFVKED